MAALVIKYMPEYLSVRALGVILLLGTEVMLDSAFLRDEPIKFVITILAYVYAVLGMFWVGAPYLFRDWFAWFYEENVKARIGLIFGCVFGMLLLLLGLFIY